MTNKGTGVVTSVPSDSPDDYMALLVRGRGGHDEQGYGGGLSMRGGLRMGAWGGMTKHEGQGYG